MKNRLFIIIFAAALFAACEDTKIQHAKSVELNQSTLSLHVGATEMLVATVLPANAVNVEVTWKSEDNDIATVSANGTVMAVAAGTTTITVTTKDGGRNSSCSVVVTTPVTGVSMNKTTLTLAAGGSETLYAIIAPDDASNKNVTWQSSDHNVATAIDGTVAGIKDGTAIVTVTTHDGNKQASCEITVNSSLVAVTQISIDKTAIGLLPGGTATIRATVLPANAYNKTVLWSSDNENVATVEDGTVTAKAMGTAKITAKTQDGNKTAECNVTVSNMPVVTTAPVTIFSSTTATLGGNIVSVGQPPYNERGVCWSTSRNPVTSEYTIVIAGSGTGNFSTSVSGLTPNTTYYARAFATNTQGTAYGEEISFTTSDTEQTQMTLTTTKSGNVRISIGISGSEAEVTVNWGDGNEDKKTIWNEDFTHFYTGTNTHTITVTGGNITHLSCSEMQVTSLDVSNNPALTFLSCSNNLLTGLNVSKNTALTTLYCSGNSLTGLDVSKNTLLQNLACGGNDQLKNLNVSNNTALTYLICNGNGLTALNINNNTELTDLQCSSNQLTSLNLNNNTKLVYLYCTYNQLTSLNAGNNTVLKDLYCTGNELSTSEMNNLFHSLHGNPISGGKYISIGDNPGDDADRSIANNKLWEVHPALALPEVSQTYTPYNVTAATARLGGNIGNLGTPRAREFGVCWSTSQNPVINDHKLAVDNYSWFEVDISGLSENTTYYVRAYATNSEGTAYGPQVEFTTTVFDMDMVNVNFGTFTIGSSAGIGEDNERPQHQVTLGAFRIGKYPVTQGQWKAMMGVNNNPSGFAGWEDGYPVENVSWNDVQEFITRLNVATGRTYRLPTEAEWEFAARGRNSSSGNIYSGCNGEDMQNYVWFNGNIGSTQSVGGKNPNELGIYDMSGNVWEWCNDWYGDYTDEEKMNPPGPSSGTERVVRGGSWNSPAGDCRVARRSSKPPGHSSSDVGFRLVLAP